MINTNYGAIPADKNQSKKNETVKTEGAGLAIPVANSAPSDDEQLLSFLILSLHKNDWTMDDLKLWAYGDKSKGVEGALSSGAMDPDEIGKLLGGDISLFSKISGIGVPKFSVQPSDKMVDALWGDQDGVLEAGEGPKSTGELLAGFKRAAVLGASQGKDFKAMMESNKVLIVNTAEMASKAKSFLFNTACRNIDMTAPDDQKNYLKEKARGYIEAGDIGALFGSNYDKLTAGQQAFQYMPPQLMAKSLFFKYLEEGFKYKSFLGSDKKSIEVMYSTAVINAMVGDQYSLATVSGRSKGWFTPDGFHTVAGAFENIRSLSGRAADIKQELNKLESGSNEYLKKSDELKQVEDSLAKASEIYDLAIMLTHDITNNPAAQIRQGYQLEASNGRILSMYDVVSHFANVGKDGYKTDLRFVQKAPETDPNSANSGSGVPEPNKT